MKPGVTDRVEKAKADNMPNDNIERAIKKQPVPWMVKVLKKLPMKDMVLAVLPSSSMR